MIWGKSLDDLKWERDHMKIIQSLLEKRGKEQIDRLNLLTFQIKKVNNLIKNGEFFAKYCKERDKQKIK